MKVLQKLNPLRRAVMHRLTGNIGSSDLPSGIDLDPKNKIKVLVVRPNHRLGNLLLITPLLQEITGSFPNAQIDLFVKGDLASHLFRSYSNVNRLIKLPRRPFDRLKDYLAGWILIRKTNYDLVINVDRGSSSGTLSTKFANAKYKIYGEHHQEIEDRLIEQKHMAKTPVYAFRKFVGKTGSRSANSVPSLSLKLTPEEITAGKDLLRELVPNQDKKIIALFTYATGDKCYASDWWARFYELIKSNFEDYQFVEILPIEKISNLDFSLPAFYSKDVREIASVIANTSLFIGADSGIMHLASASGAPTVGLFSADKEYRYGPYGEKGISVNTNKIELEESIAPIRELLEKASRLNKAEVLSLQDSATVHQSH